MLSTDKQTDRLTNATKNITSFAKEVITGQIGVQSTTIVMKTCFLHRNIGFTNMAEDLWNRSGSISYLRRTKTCPYKECQQSSDRPHNNALTVIM